MTISCALVTADGRMFHVIWLTQALHLSTELSLCSFGPLCCCSRPCWHGEDLSFQLLVGKSGLRSPPTGSTLDQWSFPQALPAKSIQLQSNTSWMCHSCFISYTSLCRQRVQLASRCSSKRKYSLLNSMCGTACLKGKDQEEARWSCQIWTELPGNRKLSGL